MLVYQPATLVFHNDSQTQLGLAFPTVFDIFKLIQSIQAGDFGGQIPTPTF